VPQQVYGRDVELAAGEQFLDGLPAGPAALLLEGDAGIGKTTVWRALLDGAAARSTRLLACQPVASETKLSHAALADLLADAADEVLPRLPEPQRRALAVALLREEPGADGGDQRATATAFLSALGVLAQSAPVVIAVDDVQWLDGSSTRVLEFAARRLGDLPVGIAVSARTPDHAGVPFGLDRALPEDRLVRVTLGPLSLSALYHLLQERLGETFERPTLVRIREASGGNPFYALELARALVQAGKRPRPGESLPVPKTLSELVADRIRALPPETRSALLIVAATSTASLDLVTTALEDPSALEPAETTGVIEIDDGRVRFTHPLLGSLAYSLAGAEERRLVHHRLAELVADLEQRARHLALATEESDEAVAETLEQAGQRAALRGAPDAAAELLEQACRLTPADREDNSSRRMVVAADYHFHAGDRPRARSLLEEVLERVGSGAVRADALRMLGEIRYHDDSFPEAIALLEEALEHGEDAVERTAPIELGLVCAFVGAVNVAGGEPHVQRALEQTEQLGEPALQAQALALSTLVDFFLGRGLDEERLARALELEDPARAVVILLRPTMVAGTLSFYSGQLDRALELYTALRERIGERGEESHLPVLAAHTAWLQCWRGDLDSAERIAREGLDTSLLVGSENMQAFARCFYGLVLAYRGDATGAGRELDAALVVFKRARFLMGLLLGLSFRGFLGLSLGDSAAAHSAMASVVGPFEEVVPEPFLAHFLPDEIEALVALGEDERAESLLDVFEAGAREHDRAWALAAAARCRGLLEASRGDFAAALEALDRALAEHERVDVPFQHARTLLVKGRIHRRNKEKRAARDALEAALEIFERLGTPLWAEQARSDLGRVGLRPPAPDGLTATEEKVAELAASGLTNRKIAETVFMTPKSVEAVISRIYRKLGVGSRAELATAMRERSTSSKG
jgi:DNA-binding CsgD family transcriptional regulator